MCERLVAEAIIDFVAERPSIQIELVPEYFPQLHDLLFQNRIDIIVGPARSAKHGTLELALEPLFEDVNVIVGRREHPLTEKNVTVADLENVTWVGHADRSRLRNDMETSLRLLGLARVRFAFQSESAGAVIELLRNSDCLTVLPRYAVRHDGGDGLAILSFDLPTQKQTIALMTLSSRADTDLTAEFKTHMRRHARMRYTLGQTASSSP